MITEKDRANGTVFQVYGQRAGRKVYVGSYASRREAVEAEEEHSVTQRKIRDGELAHDVDLKRTVSEAGEEWLKSLEGRFRSHAVYSRRFKARVRTTLGPVVLARVTRANLMRWRDDLSRLVSAATVNTTLGMLSAFFAHGVAMGWITENPCEGLPRLEERKRDFTWLKNGEQTTRLLSKCHASIRPIVAVMVGTGMRIDEVLHLQWDDVDLDHRLLHVHRGRQGTTKSGKARGVPIFDSVLVLLKQLRLSRGENVLVFPNFKGKVRSKPGVSVPFKLAVVAAGLPPAMRPHDMRHSFAIQYLHDGGDLHRLSRILGHSSVTVTERCYLAFKPTAFEADYGRVAFKMPAEATVHHLAVPALASVPA